MIQFFITRIQMLSILFISAIGMTPCRGVCSSCCAGNLYLNFLHWICFYWENLNLEFIYESCRHWFFCCLIFNIYTILLFKLAQKELYDMPQTGTKDFSCISFSKKIIFNSTICLTVEINCPWESDLNVCFWAQNKHACRKKNETYKQ